MVVTLKPRRFEKPEVKRVGFLTYPLTLLPTPARLLPPLVVSTPFPITHSREIRKPGERGVFRTKSVLDLLRLVNGDDQYKRSIKGRET